MHLASSYIPGELDNAQDLVVHYDKIVAVVTEPSSGVSTSWQQCGYCSTGCSAPLTESVAVELVQPVEQYPHVAQTRRNSDFVISTTYWSCASSNSPGILRPG